MGLIAPQTLATGMVADVYFRLAALVHVAGEGWRADFMGYVSRTHHRDGAAPVASRSVPIAPDPALSVRQLHEAGYAAFRAAVLDEAAARAADEARATAMIASGEAGRATTAAKLEAKAKAAGAKARKALAAKLADVLTDPVDPDPAD